MHAFCTVNALSSALGYHAKFTFSQVFNSCVVIRQNQETSISTSAELLRVFKGTLINVIEVRTTSF